MQKKLAVFTIFLILVTLGLFVSAVYDYAIIKKHIKEYDGNSQTEFIRTHKWKFK